MSDTSSTPEGAFIPEDRKAKGDRGPAVASVEQQRPPSFLRRQGITVLVAAIVAAVVAVVVATTISVGVQIWVAKSGGSDDRKLVQEGKVTVSDGSGDRKLVQEGKVTVETNSELEVWYKVPFASTPNLVLEVAPENKRWNVVSLKEQKADHFTIKQTHTPHSGVLPIGYSDEGRAEVRWRAEGIRSGK
jgi:hypothetical protein